MYTLYNINAPYQASNLEETFFFFLPSKKTYLDRPVSAFSPLESKLKDGFVETKVDIKVSRLGFIEQLKYLVVERPAEQQKSCTIGI